MSLTNLKKHVQNEVGVSSFFPVTHLCSSNVFETQNGMLGTVLKIDGVPFVTATDEELNHYQQIFHQALLKINHEFVIYETKVRRKKNIHFEGQFDNSFLKQIDKKYHQRFKSSSLFINEIYLTLIFKNNEVTVGKQRLTDKVLNFTSKLSDKNVGTSRALRRENGIAKLNQKVLEIMAFLEPMGVFRLGEKDHHLGFSELLTFLSLIPNGGTPKYHNRPSFTNLVTKSPKNIPNELKNYPNGHVGQFLCNHRLFFGDNIQFQGNTKKEKRYAAMMSLKQYGSETANVILDPLLHIDGEFILTQSFAPVESDLAIKDIKNAHAIKLNAEDLASSQLEELESLADLIASSKVHCGFHHNSLMLLAKDQKELDSLVNEASKAYGLANMSLVRETLALIPSFFSQIPGNTHFITRSSLITSENFADFCSFHNTQTGHHQENFLSSAVTLLETPSKTPFYFNYHVKGTKTNPSRGHALVIGGNDSGKTTTVSFIDAQMARFKNHRSIFLDRNNGLKIYILAMGGKYITVSPTHKDHCKMNPLQLEDSLENRDFCKAWLQALILQEGETNLPSELCEITNDAIDYCFDSLKPELRKLNNLASFLPLNFERWPELKRWLKGTDERAEGQFAWFFDNDEDVIHLDSSRIGFDITYVLDNLSPFIATPLFMYIMHRIELCLDGNLTSIVIDEMWQVLRTPYWRYWLEERLPSIRKDYGHIIGMTQSPKTIVDSSISSELLDNVATLILFPNPKAEQSIYIDRLGLSETEFSFIKNNSPQSRLFLYKHDTESIICKLDLNELSDEIRVFSANKASVNLMDSIIKHKGNNPQNWLPEFIKRSKA